MNKALFILGFLAITSTIISILCMTIVTVFTLDIENLILDIIRYSVLVSVVTAITWWLLFGYNLIKERF